MRIFMLFLFLLPIAISIKEHLEIIRGKSDPDPNKRCIIEYGKVKVANKASVVKGCMKYTCNYPNYIIKGCGVRMIRQPNGKKCKAAPDLTKPFPACCNSNKCQKSHKKADL